MFDNSRVKPAYVWRKLTSGSDTLLVCAYEDDEKHRQFDLEGSIGLATLQAELPTIGKEREVVFYGSCPGDASAAGQAAQLRTKGYRNAKILDGGVDAWKRAGYPVRQHATSGSG